MTVPASFYFSLGNFCLLVGGLWLLLRRPLGEFFATRAAAVCQAVETAQAALTAAERRVREYGDRLDRVEAELMALQRRFEEEGALERRAIIEQAERYAERLSSDTERLVVQEVKRAKEQLRGTTVDLAIIMAERYLREQITPEDQQQLMRRYVDRLGRLQ